MNLINLMSYNGPNGSIKRHEILKGENLDLGPSNNMSFLGPIKVHEVVKNGQNLVVSIKRHESKISYIIFLNLMLDIGLLN